MTLYWAHVAPTVLAAFLASIVECTEAMTVVLAVGAARGWRSALAGALVALLALLIMVAVLGPALARVPLDALHAVVGTLFLLFGMRWLDKAVLRAAGARPLRSEAAIYAKTRESMGRGSARAWDGVAAATAFKITIVEGIEVVFIVIAMGAAGRNLLGPAILGALGALLVVVLLGLALHRPAANIPENTLKLVVGVLITGAGTFWVGQGMGIAWPGSDLSLLGLVVAYAVAVAGCVRICRTARPAWRSS